MIVPFSSCQNEEEVQALFENSNGPFEIEANISDNFLTEEIKDSLESVETFYIDTMDDLIVPMQEAQANFKQALQRGAFENYPAATSNLTRASVTKYTEYKTRPLVLPEEEHLKMFFKSKFSATIVNKINANVSPEYKISTGTTYYCYWYVYYHKIIKNQNQRFGIEDSPNCALYPDTRTSYIQRGYSKEETAQTDGTTKIELYSFELVILYKDSNKRLDIYYPRTIDPSPWKGYEFSYNILNL